MFDIIIGGISPPRAPRRFLLQFDGGLVMELDLIHLSTAAGFGFDDHAAIRFHLPVKKKYNLCVNFKLSASAMNLDFLTCM